MMSWENLRPLFPISVVLWVWGRGQGSHKRVFCHYDPGNNTQGELYPLYHYIISVKLFLHSLSPSQGGDLCSFSPISGSYSPEGARRETREGILISLPAGFLASSLLSPPSSWDSSPLSPQGSHPLPEKLLFPESELNK